MATDVGGELAESEAGFVFRTDDHPPSPSLEESMLVLEVMTKMGSAPSRHLDQSGRQTDEWAQPMPILQGVRDFIYE